MKNIVITLIAISILLSGITLFLHSANEAFEKSMLTELAEWDEKLARSEPLGPSEPLEPLESDLDKLAKWAEWYKLADLANSAEALASQCEE